FRAVLTRAHHAIRLRDNGKSCAIKASYPARRSVAVLGDWWARRGWLRQPEDIFFLAFPEIAKIVAVGDPAIAAVDLRKLVTERREAFAYWFTVEPPEIVGADGKPVITENPNNSSTVLRGISASSGRVRGIARVILDPRQAWTIRPGEI